MKFSLVFVAGIFSCPVSSSAFTLSNERTSSPATTKTTLQSTLGDEIRENPSDETTARDNRSGYAPISQSTGQVGTFGVIGEMAYDRRKPAQFVPHSSTGAGGHLSTADTFQHASYHGGRHVPTDYNACKSFSASEDELSYFRNAQQQQQWSAGARAGGPAMTDAPTFGGVRDDGPRRVDYNSHREAPTNIGGFVPHSSTGAGGAPMSAASPSYRGNDMHPYQQ